jgi:hypothetical protein
MQKTPTRKIDLQLENLIFSHDQRLCGELSSGSVQYGTTKKRT